MTRHALLVVLACAALLAACTSDAQPTALTGEAAEPAIAAPEQARSSSSVLAQEPSQDMVVARGEGITVVGVGRISGRPDVLRVSIGVEAIRPTVQEALDAANDGASQVIAVLRDGGVADDDIQTRDLSVYPQYGDRPSARPQITGYVVTNIVEAAIRDIDAAGALIGRALRAAGDDARLQSVMFALEDNQALLDDARARAFEDARRKAEQYAQMAGGSLGRLVSVHEGVSTPPQPIPFAGREAAAADSAVPIAPGTQEVSVQVTATWQLG